VTTEIPCGQEYLEWRKREPESRRIPPTVSSSRQPLVELVNWRHRRTFGTGVEVRDLMTLRVDASGHTDEYNPKLYDAISTKDENIASGSMSLRW
jgi:hypothetical protein